MKQLIRINEQGQTQVNYYGEEWEDISHEEFEELLEAGYTLCSEIIN